MFTVESLNPGHSDPNLVFECTVYPMEGCSFGAV